MYRVFSLAAFLALMPLSLASAADIAEHRILGFSPDASVFAFEEYGVQDGSGFPYANIYFIDTEADRWLPGTPIEVVIQDHEIVESGRESAPLAREAARAEAAELLDEHEIRDLYWTLASSPLGEVESSATELAFGIQPRWNALADIEDEYRARMELYYADSPGQDCEAFMGDRPMGFRLEIDSEASGDTTLLHEDETIPRSRGCPITYRISRIVAPDAWPVERVVVLVSVIRHGFEGADRRFIAVPGRLPH